MFCKNLRLSFPLFFLLGMHMLYATPLSKEEKKAIKKEAKEAAEEYNHIAWDRSFTFDTWKPIFIKKIGVFLIKPT